VRASLPRLGFLEEQKEHLVASLPGWLVQQEHDIEDIERL
jgi:hypothetical protein